MVYLSMKAGECDVTFLGPTTRIGLNSCQLDPCVVSKAFGGGDL